MNPFRRRSTAACLALLAFQVGACTINQPRQLVPTTAPIDDHRRINTVGKEAFGESCQWWFALGGLVIPSPVRGNQDDLALKAALEGKYDGLVGATADNRITWYGLMVPVEDDWVGVSLTFNCEEVRGTPFVYTEPLPTAP